jgi:hypothetical protein
MTTEPGGRLGSSAASGHLDASPAILRAARPGFRGVPPTAIRMQTGSPMQGMVYLGEVASPTYFEKSASVDNLRRGDRWYNVDERSPGAS